MFLDWGVYQVKEETEFLTDMHVERSFTFICG